MVFAVSDKGNGSRTFFRAYDTAKFSSHHDHHMSPSQHMIKKAFDHPAAYVRVGDEFVEVEALNAIG